MTAITKCYPGRVAGGSGDRRPSGPEIALCRPFLEAQLRLVQPRAMLLVGGLAIDRYFPKRPLTENIGKRFDIDGVSHNSATASLWGVSLARRCREPQTVVRGAAACRAEWERWVLDGGESETPAEALG